MKIKAITIILLCITTFSACKEEFVYPNLITEFIDIKTNSSGRLSELISDNGRQYSITERSGLDGFTPDSIYRTLSMFEYEENNNVKLYSCLPVLAMIPQPVEFFKGQIKTDPLDIQRIWRSGNYINMILSIQGKDKPHAFHFVDEGIKDNKLTLTIYHDQMDDYKAFKKDVHISIPLWPYEGKLNKGDKVKVKINTFKEGNTFREFEY